MYTKYGNVTIDRLTPSKIKITIDIADASVGSHYIEGVIYHTWKKYIKDKSPISLDDFFKSICAVSVINVDEFYKKNNGCLKHFYNFLNDYYKFKENYNIRLGDVYTHDIVY